MILRKLGTFVLAAAVTFGVLLALAYSKPCGHGHIAASRTCHR